MNRRHCIVEVEVEQVLEYAFGVACLMIMVCDCICQTHRGKMAHRIVSGVWAFRSWRELPVLLRDTCNNLVKLYPQDCSGRHSVISCCNQSDYIHLVLFWVIDLTRMTVTLECPHP